MFEFRNIDTGTSNTALLGDRFDVSYAVTTMSDENCFAFVATVFVDDKDVRADGFAYSSEVLTLQD